MKRTLLILLLISGVASAHGQYLKVAGDTTRTALFLDAGRLWNYNLYEHSRWGGGLRLTTHPSQFIFSAIDAEAYLGYGVFDEQFKAGIALSEAIRHSRHHSVHYQHVERDYFPVGSRQIVGPWSAGGQLLGGFMSRRMTDNRVVTLGHRWHTDTWRWGVEISWGERGWLFDEKNLLYNIQDPISYESFGRVRLLLRHRCGIAAQYEFFSDWHTMRLLVNYRKSLHANPLRLDIFAQGGLTPKENSYIDMFDLGGTWAAPVYFGGNLPTIRPNEFTANAFTLLNLRLQTSQPSFRIYNKLFSIGSNPYPFLSLTALWGSMWEQDASGKRPWLTTYLQAPNKGLLEATLGLDGIIRWGAVDFGAAASYRIAPANAAYHHSTRSDNFILLITAKLAE